MSNLLVVILLPNQPPPRPAPPSLPASRLKNPLHQSLDRLILCTLQPRLSLWKFLEQKTLNPRYAGWTCNICNCALFESVGRLKICYFVLMMVLLDHFLQVPESVFPIYVT